MSSEEFEDAEEEFTSYFNELQNLINNRLNKLQGEARKKELRNAEKLYEDADLQLSQMVDEAQKAPGAFRTQLMGKTRTYRADLTRIKRELVKISSASAIASSSSGGLREDLLETSSQNKFQVEQRNKMIEGLESLNRGSQSVGRSQRIAAETDEVGVQIIGDLDDQRESLIRTKDKLKETETNLGKSRRILNSMAIRVATNKLLLAIIIVMELAILGGVVYLKFFNKKKKT